MTTSTLPNALWEKLTNASTSSRFVTSSARYSAEPPSARMAETSDSSLSVRRAPRTTCAPLCASRRAVASPIPLLAPVITTTFPSMFTAIISPFGLLPRDGGITNLISHVLTHLYSRQLFAQHPQTLGQFRINSPRKHAGQRLI